MQSQSKALGKGRYLHSAVSQRGCVRDSGVLCHMARTERTGKRLPQQSQGTAEQSQCSMCAILRQRAKLVQNIRSAVARKGTSCACFFHYGSPFDLYFDQTLSHYMKKSLHLFRLFILQPTPDLAKASCSLLAQPSSQLSTAPCPLCQTRIHPHTAPVHRAGWGQALCPPNTGTPAALVTQRCSTAQPPGAQRGHAVTFVLHSRYRQIFCSLPEDFPRFRIPKIHPVSDWEAIKENKVSTLRNAVPGVLSEALKKAAPAELQEHFPILRRPGRKDMKEINEQTNP